MTRRFSGGEPVLGLILAVPLGDGMQAYGRVLSDSMEFFALRDPEGTNPGALEPIVRGPRAFRHGVSYQAIRSRRWTALGVVPLTQAEEADKLAMWRLDIVTGFAYRYAWSPDTFCLGNERLSRAQCEQLELASVMAEVHVEERLRDFFAGTPYIHDLYALAQVKDP